MNDKEMSRLLVKETQLHCIVRKTSRKPHDCKCSLCKVQCHIPCLGTPQDTERLIDAGYANKLTATPLGVGMITGTIDILVPVIQAAAGDEYCVFYRNGLCGLYDKGLKPTEGRLSHHSTRLNNLKASENIAWNIAKEWLSANNAEAIECIADKFDRDLNARKL